jgi:hypothetical protein
MIGNTYWPSTGVAVAAASVTARTANGHRRRTSSGRVAASPNSSPSRTRSCSAPLATVVLTTGTPTATVSATSTMRGDGWPSHARSPDPPMFGESGRRAEDTR